MPSLIRDFKQTVTDYKTELFSLKAKTLTVNKSICNLDYVISSIQTSSQTQEQKVTSLDTLNNKCEDFIEDASRIDSNVADVVNQRKNDFYDKYYYLKPECEKSGWEKYIKDNAIAAWEWCKENWKTVIKIIVVIVLVAVSVVLLCTGVGGILAAMAWGAIIGSGIGGFSGGIMSAISGGSFFEGFVNGAFTGAIGGAIGGGITSGLTSLIGPATTLLGSIAQGAAIGAVSGGVSNMAVSAISIYLEKGSLSGSLGTILFSGFTGALAGGIVGGLIGGLQFKANQLKLNYENGGKTSPAKIVRELGDSESMQSITNEMKELTYQTANEHAMVTLKDGTRVIVSGGEAGISFSKMPITEIAMHTHPYTLPASGPSAADIEAIARLGQTFSYLLEHGELIKFFANLGG